jgi:general secretion pathway protein E
LGISSTSPPTLFAPAGCERCNQSGYRGRAGIFELVPVDPEMQTMIHDGTGELALEQHARKQTHSIRDDGQQRVLNGETSLEELVRVTSSE